MAKMPFGKRNSDLIEDVSEMSDSQETVGKGIFGDGVSDPLYSLEASRLKGGRLFSPNIIAIWPDRIEEHEVHAIRKSGIQTIHFRQVAQVAIENGLIYTNIIVESAGGHVIRLVGVPGDDSVTVKRLLDEAVRTAHKSQGAHAVAKNVPQVDVADQLTKLAALRDSGVLTEEEFLGQKKRILGS